MGNRKLYIIGNGFDLWHGIPSKYADFKAYVRQHDRELLRTVDDYLPAGDDWSDLESALADLDIDSIIDDLSQFMPSYGADDWSDAGHHDFQYEVDRVVQSLSKELRQQFSAWVHQLPIPSPATAQRRLSTLDPTSRFLSFNYTPTLQQLYGVPGEHVLHIHGSADRPDSDIVLGHAWNPSTRPSLNDRHDVEDLDVRLMEANDILDGYFSKTFKPSSRLIQEHRSFWTEQLDADMVCVLGHSLSAVDAPYFEALVAVPAIAAAQWLVVCRDESEAPSKAALLARFGVNGPNISTCLWSGI